MRSVHVSDKNVFIEQSRRNVAEKLTEQIGSNFSKPSFFSQSALSLLFCKINTINHIYKLH